MTAFFISTNCFSPRYPLHSQATAPGRQGQSSRVESSVLNVNRASPISDSRDIHCSLLENVLFIIGKSTLNCWDRMRCFGGRLNCRLSVQYSHTPVCQLVSPIADHRWLRTATRREEISALATSLGESHALGLLCVGNSTVFLDYLIDGNLVEVLQIKAGLARLYDIADDVMHVAKE